MTPATRATSIAELTAMMDAVQTDGRLGRSAGNGGSIAKPVETAWGEVARQAAHEWFADAPPLALMIDLVRRVIGGHGRGDEDAISPATRGTASGAGGGGGGGGAIFWMGRACWPYPQSLVQACGSDDLLNRSIFVDMPSDRNVRVWAIDLVLRSSATLAVIADGRALNTAQSRRVQLAAEAGDALAMFWRRFPERRTLSVAHHRWLVMPIPTMQQYPRWRVERVRCKEVATQSGHGLPGGHVNIIVEQRGAEGIVAVSADVADRSHQAATQSLPRIIRRAQSA